MVRARYEANTTETWSKVFILLLNYPIVLRKKIMTNVS